MIIIAWNGAGEIVGAAEGRTYPALGSALGQKRPNGPDRPTPALLTVPDIKGTTLGRTGTASITKNSEVSNGVLFASKCDGQMTATVTPFDWRRGGCGPPRGRR